MANNTLDDARERVDGDGPADHRLREALTTLNDGIAIYDADGYLSYCNDSFRRICGYSEADTEPGVATYDSLGQLDRANAIVEHTPLPFVERVAQLRRDNANVVVQHHDHRVYERRQSATPSGGLISVISDISARYRLEVIQQARNNVLELLAKGRALEVVLKSLIEGCEALNRDMLGSVLLLDESGTRLLLGAAPSLPKFYNEAIHGIEIGNRVGSCGTAAHNGERVIVGDITTHPYWTDYRDIAKEAGLYACWSQPIFSAGGKVLGTFAMYYKERREPNGEDLKFINGSAHLAGIAIETRQTEKARNVALKKAEEANRVKSEFLATLSHEFRTPLNAILGFSEMLKSPEIGNITPERSQEYLSDIHSSAMHLLSLVTDVLDVSAIEAGKRSVFKEEIAIDEVLRDCVRNVAPQAAQGYIDLSCEISDNLPLLHAERRSVIQIVLNLLSNAVKFTEPNGTVVMSAMADNKNISIEVRDTGIGISPDRLPTITEPFSQGHADPYKTQLGTGLGLSIAKSLIEAHGGTLHIHSELGAGTTATVMFPAGTV